LPSATSVMKQKSDKILNQAVRLAEGHNLQLTGSMLHKKAKESGYPIEYLAAALLQMQMGDEITEISQEPHWAAAPAKKKKRDGKRKRNPGRRRN
ncbi:hypothetical protein LI291_15180, partial [Intestinibacillus massiliensis]|nr:hypothetical protein [Intestinibacillus massiliensis]